jgi:hypothetical protein
VREGALVSTCDPLPRPPRAPLGRSACPRVGAVAATSGLDRVRDRAVHDGGRHADRQRGAADAQPRFRRSADRRAVDRDRLPADARGRDPRLGLDRRPRRDEADVPVRAGAVHGRVGVVRRGRQPSRADRRPRAAGGRRRHADPDRDRDAVSRLRPRAAGQGRADVDPADPDRAGGGTDPRRRPHAGAVVAMGVPAQRADRDRDARLRLSVRARAPAVARRSARPARDTAVRNRAERSVIRDQRGIGDRLGGAPDPRHRHRRHRTAVGVRAGLAAPARPDPAGAVARRAAAALDERRFRPDHRRVPGQPLPDPDLLAGGAAPVADQLGRHHVRGGDRRRRGRPDLGSPVPVLRSAGDGRLRGRGVERLHGAVPTGRARHEPVAGAGADVLRRRRQRRRLSVAPDLDVHAHLARRHRTRLGDLQHDPPILDRARHRRVDDRRRGRRRHHLGGFPCRLPDRSDPRGGRVRAGLDADQH